MGNKYNTKKHTVPDCVVTHGLIPTAAQLSTITFLQTNLDAKIELIAPGHGKNSRKRSPLRQNGAFRMSGKIWALKNPTGSSPRTLQRAFRDALRCARHIVIDLGNTDIDDDAAIQQLEKLFDASDSAHDLLIVTSQAKLAEYHRP